MSSSHTKPKSRLCRVLLAIAAGVTAAAVLVAGVYAVLYYRGWLNLGAKGSALSAPQSLVEDMDDDPTRVTYKGVDYRYNTDVISVLFIGVDKLHIASDEGYGSNGQADCLFVAAIDTANNVTRIIPLSRESMVDVNIYGLGGGYAGVEKTQLCLAYAYGATGEESCENVVRSAKRMLYGVDINAYAAIDLDGLGALTHAVGGLTVTTPEAIHHPRLQLEQGQTVTLNRETAVLFVQHRTDDLYGNTRRQARQQRFLSAFISKAKEQVLANPARVTSLYNTAKPYLVSNIGLSDLTYMASNSLSALSNLTFLSIEGETVMGDQYVEFYPDSTSVYETVLEAFYQKVEE